MSKAKRATAPTMTEEDYQMLVGKVVAHLRKLHDWSQQKLADELGCAQSTITRIESGSVSPSIYRVARLAMIFDCKVSDIVVDLRRE